MMTMVLLLAMLKPSDWKLSDPPAGITLLVVKLIVKLVGVPTLFA